MPAKLKVIRLDDGQSFFFEEDVPEHHGLEEISIGDLEGKIDFDKVLGTIRVAAEHMSSSLRSLPSAPSTVEISFGIKLSSEVGAILAKAGGEANFDIKLSWSKKSD